MREDGEMDSSDNTPKVETLLGSSPKKPADGLPAWVHIVGVMVLLAGLLIGICERTVSNCDDVLDAAAD